VSPSSWLWRLAGLLITLSSAVRVIVLVEACAACNKDEICTAKFPESSKEQQPIEQCWNMGAKRRASECDRSGALQALFLLSVAQLP